MAGAKKFFKKRSKRIPTKLRVKAEKKLREHNRKVRKEKRKNPGKAGKKKDPGVPAECPFKEDVLREVDDMRRQKEREKENRRQRAKEMKQNGGNAAEADTNGNEDVVVPTSVPWEQVVKENKVILHVLDARRPEEAMSEEVAAAVADHDGHKRIVYVLAKADLVPRDNLREWLDRLRARGRTAVAFRSSVVLERSKSGLENRSKAAGVDTLMFLLQSYCKRAGVADRVQIGVVGQSKVGKHSLIQTLMRSKPFNADKMLELAQVPGSIEQKRDFTDAEAFLGKCDPKFLQLRYGLPAFDKAADFVDVYAEQSHGGDREAAMQAFAKDVDGARFKFCTRTPVRGDEEESDGGESEEDLFNLDKVSVVERGDLEQLPKVLDCDVMKLVEAAETKKKAAKRAKSDNDVKRAKKPKTK